MRSQKTIALLIARILALHVFLQRIRASRIAHLQRMIDDQMRANAWLDNVWMLSMFPHGIAQRREFGEQRHARHVRHQNACDRERNLLATRRVGFAVREMLDMSTRYFFAVEVAQRCFENYPQAVGKAQYWTGTRRVQRRE